ncbi:GNAT family N-acetyltransferase [Cupriavidus alkaliphilus]|uniref:GNAT family N-acetyltransferase n=1 Tax=Cupriavidus alkaliphilus TaxID=942866 RepID=UPI00160A6ACA
MPEGRIVGSLNGHLMMQWLAVNVIWIAEDLRGHGIGSRLLLQAESSARALGTHGAHLDTFEWQAASFYSKHGYAEFGRLNDFPLGSYRLFMSKRL